MHQEIGYCYRTDSRPLETIVCADVTTERWAIQGYSYKNEFSLVLEWLTFCTNFDVFCKIIWIIWI